LVADSYVAGTTHLWPLAIVLLIIILVILLLLLYKTVLAGCCCICSLYILCSIGFEIQGTGILMHSILSELIDNL